MQETHEWLARWAMEHGASSQNASAFAMLAMVFAAALVVIAVIRMFSGSGGSSFVEEDGKKFAHMPGVGWVQGYHNSETGQLDSFKVSEGPRSSQKPPAIIPAKGVRLTRGGR